MFVEAYYMGNKVMLNAEYIVDIWTEDGNHVAYTADCDRAGYVISAKTYNKLISEDNND